MGSDKAMNTESKIAVMSAEVDGEAIQYRHRKSTKAWLNIYGRSPSWNWAENDYRIKSEEKKPVIIETWRGSAGQVVFCEAGTVTSIEKQTYGWALLATRSLGV